jgi:hypothetical protein
LVDELDPVSVLGDVEEGGVELLGGGTVGAAGSTGRMLGEAEGDVVPPHGIRSVREGRNGGAAGSSLEVR